MIHVIITPVIIYFITFKFLGHEIKEIKIE